MEKIATQQLRGRINQVNDLSRQIEQMQYQLENDTRVSTQENDYNETNKPSPGLRMSSQYKGSPKSARHIGIRT